MNLNKEHSDPAPQQGQRQQRFEGTDLVLLRLDLSMPKHGSGFDIIATEQMDGMGLMAGGPKRFAINGHLGMVSMPFWRLKATWFGLTSLLSFPADKERREERIEVLCVQTGEQGQYVIWHGICVRCKPKQATIRRVRSGVLLRFIRNRRNARSSRAVP